MNPKNGAVDADAAKFRSTHWSVVLAAAQDQMPADQAALDELYRSYWYPLYAHVRLRGYTPQDAQDLTQDFFLHLLEHRGLAQVDPHKGRFRSFLLASLQNFLLTAQRQKAHNQARRTLYVHFPGCPGRRKPLSGRGGR